MNKLTNTQTHTHTHAQVTVVEFMDHIVPTMDGEIRRNFQRSLQKQGMAFKLGTKVRGPPCARPRGPPLACAPAQHVGVPAISAGGKGVVRHACASSPRTHTQHTTHNTQHETHR